MKLLELTEFLIKKIVSDPDTVSLKQFEEDEEIIIEVLVDEKDMGQVIGRGGKTANAIRTIVQAAAYQDTKKRIKINIDSM